MVTRTGTVFTRLQVSHDLQHVESLVDPVAKRGTSRTIRELVDLCDAPSADSENDISGCSTSCLSPCHHANGVSVKARASTSRKLDGRERGQSRVRRKRAPRLPFQDHVLGELPSVMPLRVATQNQLIAEEARLRDMISSSESIVAIEEVCVKRGHLNLKMAHSFGDGAFLWRRRIPLETAHSSGDGAFLWRGRIPLGSRRIKTSVVRSHLQSHSGPFRGRIQ